MAMTLAQATSLYLDINNPPTGDLRTDLLTSGRVAARWRRIGPEATATILHALHRHHGMSQHAIAQETGIAQSTVSDLIRQLETGRWGELPEGGSHD